MKTTAGEAGKNPQKSLEASELRYRRLFEAAQDGILILDAKTGMIEDVNPYLITMLGYSREEFVEKKLWDVGAFRDVEASKEAFEILQDREYIRYENLPLKTKDGRLIQVEFVSNVYLAGAEKVIQCNIRDITEHKRIVLALQANERKYYDLLAMSPDGIFIIDLTGRMLAVNKAMCRELGFSEEEFLAMKIWDIIPEKNLSEYKGRLTKMLAGEVFDGGLEYEVRGKDGRNHYVEIFSTPHYDETDIVGFQGIAHDITLRKQTVEALRLSEQRFKMASWATKDVIWERNFPANTISWNESVQKLFHYTAEEIEPTVDWWQDHIHPAERAKVLASIQAAIVQEEKFWSREYRFRLPDGSYADVFDRGYILYNEQGQPLQFIGAMVDVTKQKQAEKALQSSEEKYRALVMHLPTVIYTNPLDDASSTLYVSPQIERLLGYTPQEWLADPELWSKAIHPEDRPEVLKQTSLLNKSREPFEMDYRMTARDGRLVWVHDRLTLVNDLEGKPQYWQGIMLDITESKQAEEQMRSSRGFLQSVQNALSAHIAILDQEGNIVQVNSGWRDFGAKNGLNHPDHCIGRNYLEICDSATGESAEEAPLIAKAIREVLSGGQDEVSVEYPCHAPHKKRWFVARVTSFINDQQRWIVVAHENITARKLAEEKTQRQVEHLLALSSIDRMISANFDLKLTLSEILTHVTAELKVDAADILILDTSSQILEFGAEHGFRTNIIRSAQVRLGESYAGRVAMERKLVQVKARDKDAGNLFLKNILQGEDFYCYFGVPLITKGQLRGVLEVYHRSMLEPDGEWFEFLHTLAGQAAIATENAMLFESLQRSSLELSLAYDATIEGWSRALDLRDKETEGHSLRVTDMTVKLARTLGLNDEELVQVRWGSLLHDIGKMGVPDQILLKSSALTEDEWVAMKKHPTFAYEMLSPIRYLRLALDIPYCHHEKWDGSGYPRGLKGDQIPLTARIFAIVDVWDALTSDRPYRAAWTKEEAISHIRASAGTHFDTNVVNVFMHAIVK
jgi:PAS domain S-box-containing protein/putative nucleotidyltransferase with HDIG domain